MQNFFWVVYLFCSGYVPYTDPNFLNMEVYKSILKWSFSYNSLSCYNTIHL